MPATTKPTSVLFLDVNDVPAVKKLKKFTKTLKRNATAWNQSLELVGKAFKFLDGTIGALIRAQARWGKQAAYQIQVENRLKAVLAQRGEQVERVFEALQKENAARQALLGVGDEEQLQLQGTLALMGVRTKNLNEATKATFALAEVTGGSLKDASRVVAKVFQGQVSALREYGITATSVQQAQTLLNEKFQTLAANAQTVQGRVKVLTANWADFTEALGMAGQRSPLVRDMLDAMAKAVAKLTEVVSKDPKVLADLFVFALEPALDLMRALNGALKIIDKLYKARREFAQIIGGRTPSEEDLKAGGIPGLAGASGAIDTLIENLAAAVARAKKNPGAVLDFKIGGSGRGRGGRGGGIETLSPVSVVDADDDAFRTQQLINRRMAGAIDGADPRVRGRPAEGIKTMSEAVAALRSEFSGLLDLVKDFDITWSGVVEGLGAGADMLGNTLKSAIDGFGKVLGQHIADLITGADNLGKSVSEAVGDMLVALGTQLIQMGTAALIMGALSFIPGLQAFTGAPGAGLVAGAIAIPAGLAMVGIGKSMGGGGPAGGGRQASSAPGGSGRGRGPTFDAVPDASTLARRDRESQTVVHEVHFNGIVGDPRRVRRMLKDLWDDTSLSPGDRPGL